MPLIRADFSRPVWLNPEDGAWVASPQGGVERLMLDRVGDEVAVATSLVRYAPHSRFPAHEHALGEEFLVLEGVFADEHGNYPAGTYVRNPPGTRHTPFSDPGCLIWVKLRQFDPPDQQPVVASLPDGNPPSSLETVELYRYGDEVVSCLRAPAGAAVELPGTPAVQEMLVVDGAVRWDGVRLSRHGWLRVPAGQALSVEALEPCRLLHKTRPAYAIPRAEGQAS